MAFLCVLRDVPGRTHAASPGRAETAVSAGESSNQNFPAAAALHSLLKELRSGVNAK